MTSAWTQARVNHQLAELLPLSYPDDVVALVHSWLPAADKKRGAALLQRLEQRPDLARAATVPMVWALYCLVAADGPLPGTRSALYDQVVEKLLVGAWRQSYPGNAILKRALAAVIALAWNTATNDDRSGLGSWGGASSPTPSMTPTTKYFTRSTTWAPVAKDFPHGRRRFVHRTIREYLVAEHVSELPTDEAAERLEPHLWFDPDCEEVVCVAIARHDKRDELLSRLIPPTKLGPMGALAARDGFSKSVDI